MTHNNKFSQSNLGTARRFCTTTQQSPSWFQEDASHLPRKLSHPFDDHHPSLYTHLSADPTHHPKRHPDQVSRFATVHFPNRHTHRPTDGIGDRSTPIALTLYYIMSDGLTRPERDNSRVAVIYRVAEVSRALPVVESAPQLLRFTDKIWLPISVTVC